MTENNLNREDIPEYYQFQVSLTDHPIVKDEQGVLRYRRNPLIYWLCDHIDLNEMRLAYHYGAFSQEAYMQFYRDIGYSLSGFEDVWGDALNELEEKR